MSTRKWDGNERRANGFTHEDGVSLKEYFEETCRAKMDAHDKALTLARDSMEKRLEGMNEFREQLKDQASRFITRTEHDALISKYDMEIKALTKAKDLLEGKADQKSVFITQVIAIISLLMGLITILRSFSR